MGPQLPHSGARVVPAMKHGVRVWHVRCFRACVTLSLHPVASAVTRCRGMSWADLVAETAGLGELSCLHVEVRWKGLLPPGWRLVVQEFDGGEYASDRPIAAAQRAVGEQAGRAMRLKLYRRRDAGSRSSHVVAWLEPGPTELDYDGLRAHPSRAAWVARATTRRAFASVYLVPGRGVLPEPAAA